MLLKNKMDKLKKLKTLQNSRQKRIRNNNPVESDSEEEIHSPRKQRKVGQEIVHKSKLNADSDISSDNEESDSDSDVEILFEKLKEAGRRDDTMSDEGLKDNDSSDGDDDVDGNDSDSNIGEDAESDDGEDSVDDDDDDNSDDDELNTIKESDKTKSHKADKIAPRTEMLQSGKEINESETSGDEDSGDSSESDSNKNDDEEIMKSGYKRGAGELKTKNVEKKQQVHKTDTSSIGNNKQIERANHESSEDDESIDSSEDDDEDSYHGDDKVKYIESKNDTHSKLKVGSSINKQYEKSIDSYSDNDDDDSDDDNESEEDDELKTNNDEKGVSSSQTSKKRQLYSKVTEDAENEMKESSSDSAGSDSSDEDDDVKGASTAEHHAENEKVEDEFAAVKKELANVPLEDLMKIKEKLGLKVFNKIMHGDKFEEKKQKVFKRENKNRPMELSSKKRVSVIRHATVAKEKVRRDPRFDDLSGEFQDKHFMKNYSFLSDIKSKEKLLVQKKMDKTKDEDKKKELAKLLNRMNQQEQIEQQKRQRMEMEQQWKEKEKQLVKEGKTPYFLKKSEKKKLELAEKFKELQKSGKVDKYMSKKLKKNAQKEKKKLPGRHQRFM